MSHDRCRTSRLNRSLPFHRRTRRSATRVATTVALLVISSGALLADTLKVPSEAFPTIQSAVSAGAPGDVISVAKGVYREQVSVFSPGITVLGKKAVIDAGFDGPCFRVGAVDVTISGFVLLNGTAGVVDEAGAFGGAGAEGFVTPNRLRVTHCIIRSCIKGVSIAAREPTVTNNEIVACELVGIELDATDGLQPAVVKRNTVERISQGDGISIEAKSVLLERNELRAIVGSGIRLDLTAADEGESAPPSMVLRNRAEGVLNIGLIVTKLGGATTSIEKNRMRRNGRGMEVNGADFQVLGNDCSGNAEVGMYLGTESLDHFVQSVVRNNRCRNNGAAGLRLDGPFICRINPTFPNLIEGNDCQGNGQDGIVILHAHQDELTGNSSKRNGGDGIDIERSYNNIVLAENICLKNEHEGIDNLGKSTRMRDNICKGNGRGLGPDIAGTGDDGSGSVLDLGGNSFVTGGFNVEARLDLGGVP
ncbi:MAG: hypothetical protein DHS20C15_32300 [Planctomycetota bacterium]|nr:MAG: hypothetical protein DHS20C15_32300 [Planctomycetota bacterium]